MDTTFTFLGLTGHAYGLCAAVAAALLLIGMKLAGRRLPVGTVSLFGVLGIALGVVGARVLYCLCNVTSFTETFENPWLMLNFFDGGLSWPGMLLGLLAAAAIAARAAKVSFADVMDAACLPMGLSMAALRLGEPFTDLGVGKAVTEGFATANLPWLFQQSRMGVAVEYRLNVWMYEAVAGAVIFVLCLLLYRRFSKRSGCMALFFFSLFGASQILLESMRDDGHMLLIFLRIGQVGAALMPLIATGILLRGESAKRKALTWLVQVICMALIVVLEFSLDGRLTFGTPTLLRDYSIMAVVCAVMFAQPCALLWKKTR